MTRELDKRPRPRYTLDELLEQCDASAEPDPGDESGSILRAVNDELI
jgi:hypothetical protein